MTMLLTLTRPPKSWNVLVVVSCLYASLVSQETTAANCSVPLPVTELVAKVVTYNFFKLTWQAPSNVPYSCIVAYNVCFGPTSEPRQHCAGSKTETFSNNAAMPTSPCANYTASVVVFGNAGDSNGTTVTFFTGADTVYWLTASNTTSTATHLTWQSPDTTPCASHLKLYHCAVRGSPARQDCTYRSTILPLNATRTTLTGLEPCEDNRIRLATVDDFGGERYESIVVHTGNGHPPPVAGVSARNNRGSSFVVTWRTPAGFDPRCHGGYKVCSTSGRDGEQQCFFTSDNSSTISRATACTNYTVRVQTVDGELKEDSPLSASGAVHVTTEPAMPPVTIGYKSYGGISIEMEPENVASLSWPRPDNLSATCLRGYEVTECVQRPYTGGCHILHRNSLPANTTAFNSSRLTSCATSLVTFSVVGKDGARSSMNLLFTNSQGSLQPLTNISVVRATSTQFTLAWTPSDFNKCTDHYRVCWLLYHARKCQDVTGDTGGTFTNVSLAACHTYTVSIVAASERDKNFSSPIQVDMAIGPENAVHQSVQVMPTSALVTWTRETTAHRCNTGYRITWCPATMFVNTCGPSPTGTVSLSDTVTRYNITGLETCAKYLIVFQTLGSNESLSSDENATVVHTPIGKFGPITDLRIHQRANDTVTMDVVFPYNTTKCISIFTTCLYETDSAGTEKYCRLMRTEWVNMTQPCTNYTVDITAVTYNKLTSNGSTTFATGPGHVRDVSVKEDIATVSANVSWVTPGTKYSRCVLYLDVRCTPAEASEPVLEQRLLAEATGVHLEGLSKCTSYTLQIQAVGAGGLLGKAVVKQFATTWSVLEKVQELEVANVSASGFSLSWKPPEHRDCVVSYRICWGAEGAGTTCETTFANNWVSSQVDVLQPCTKYTVSVATVDDYGKSSDNVTTTFQTGAAKVTGVTANVSTSGKAVTVSWTYPKSNVHCVSYQAVSFVRIRDNVTMIRKNVSKEDTETGYGGLQHCLRYMVEVQPITLKSASPPATTKDFRTTSDVNSLSGLEVTALGQDALHINYSIAEVSSYCVDHFLICWEARGTNTSCSNKQGHTSSSVNITGLSPATNYTVHVTPVAPDGSRYHTTSATATTPQCDSCTGGETTVRSQLSVVLLLPVLLLLRRWH